MMYEKYETILASEMMKPGSELERAIRNVIFTVPKVAETTKAAFDLNELIAMDYDEKELDRCLDEKISSLDEEQQIRFKSVYETLSKIENGYDRYNMKYAFEQYLGFIEEMIRI